LDYVSSSHDSSSYDDELVFPSTSNEGQRDRPGERTAQSIHEANPLEAVAHHSHANLEEDRQKISSLLLEEKIVSLMNRVWIRF
jgi:hypothetical protein